MADRNVWLHQAMVTVGEDGVIKSLSVDLGGAEIHADIADVDVEAITGEGAAAKTLANIVTALAPLKKPAASTSESQTSVAQQSVAVVAANANRVRATITNTSDSAILWLSYGGTAVANKGIPVYPHEHFDEEIYTGAINGIMSAGTVLIPWCEL